jgi:hypothetical protein
MNEIESKVSARLVGMACHNVRVVEGGTLILYLSHPSGGSANAKLRIDCAWRLTNNGKVRIGSLDDGETVVGEVRHLVGQTITSVLVDPFSKDIQIVLSAGFAVHAFCHCTQMELWEVRGDDGYRLGVGQRLEIFEYMASTENSLPDDGTE